MGPAQASCEPFQPNSSNMSALTRPEPIAACFAADTQGPDRKLAVRRERGLITRLEITA